MYCPGVDVLEQGWLEDVGVFWSPPSSASSLLRLPFLHDVFLCPVPFCSCTGFCSSRPCPSLPEESLPGGAAISFWLRRAGYSLSSSSSLALILNRTLLTNLWESVFCFCRNRSERHWLWPPTAGTTPTCLLAILSPLSSSTRTASTILMICLVVVGLD